MYKLGILTDANFFDDKNWTGRGKTYRMLVEPLDIANWYYKEKNIKYGHYAEGIQDALKDDNKKRPGRYILLQQQEHRVFGEAESSLGKAKFFEELLGRKSWKDYLREVRLESGILAFAAMYCNVKKDGKLRSRKV